MKKQNQTSEGALEAANRIYNGLQINPDFGTNDVAEIIQHCIDAATAEVKKEGSKKSLGSETPATMGVVSEQTGDTERLNWIEYHRATIRTARIVSTMRWEVVTFYRNAYDLWSETIIGVGDTIREAISDAMNLRSPTRENAQGSEVPAQKAPTDSSKEKETATCLAAPSRKQKTDEEIAHAFAVNISSAAARVEPTKEAWTVAPAFGHGEVVGTEIWAGAELIARVFDRDKREFEKICAAHNASCAPTKEEEESL